MKNLQFLFFYLFLFIYTSFYAQVHVGDLTLTTQEEIDNFNYKGVNGSINIESNSLSDPITNLNSFSSIQFITEDLIIRNSPQLTSLNGLNNLESVGFLFIENNTLLANFEGLEKLKTITSGFSITNSPTLTSFTGLNNLESTGNFTIQGNNNSLINFEGLEKLKSIDGDLFLRFSSFNENDEPKLNSFTGLTSLETISGIFSITRFPLLTQLNELDNLITIGNSLIIEGNTNLTTISLPALTSIGENNSDTFNGIGLNISSNRKLTNINLNNLSILKGGLNITDGTDLLDFCFVASLISNNQLSRDDYTINSNGYNPDYDEIQSTCSITEGDNGNGVYNGSLTLSSQSEIDSFRFQEITGHLVVREDENSVINHLIPLRQLTKVGGPVGIVGNSQLQSLKGLENIESPITVSISGNSALTSLTGIPSLEKTTRLFISSNNNLRTITNIQDNTSSFLSEVSVFIFENPKLTNLQGLNDITNIKTLSINNNDSLINLQGLNQLTNIFNCFIQNNSSLKSLHGLDQLENLDQFSFIRDNSSLLSLDGLNQLNSVNTLSLINNASLQSLNGLENLTTVNRTLIIQDNEELISLNGLENLISARSGLRITNNTNLSNFCALKVFSQNQNNRATFLGNAINPTRQEFLDGIDCGPQDTNDDDFDSVINEIDLCPNTPLNTMVYSNGCPIDDMDNDNVIDSVDFCPNTPAGESVNLQGCSNSQKDDDNDGILNPDDLCPNTPILDIVDKDGCTRTLSNELIFKSSDSEIKLTIDQSILNIEWSEFKSLKLYNSQGSLLVQSKTNQTTIENLSSGIYFLEISSKNNTIHRIKVAK